MSDQTQPLALIDRALTLEDIVKTRRLIEGVMSAAMKENTHYGKIPGSKQPSLLKPGAQLLCSLFRLRAEYDVEEIELAGGHKRFKVRTRLYILGTEPPIPVAEGRGEASSMESKHRFRNDASAGVELTAEPVPGMYWSIKKKDGREEADRWLGGAFDGKKVSPRRGPDDTWVVAIVTGDTAKKTENENIADVWNTVLKMACKRSYVDATITATASNDFFTQDLEDIRENLEVFRRENPEPEHAEGTEKPVAGKTVESKPASWKTTVNHIGKKGGPIQGKQLGALDDGQRAWLLKTISEKGERASASDKKVLAGLKAWQAEQSAPKPQPPGKTQDTGKAGAAEGNTGVNLDVLAQNLDWAEIATEAFLAVAHREGWTNAEKFADITDAEATAMVSNIDQVTDKCRAEAAAK